MTPRTGRSLQLFLAGALVVAGISPAFAQTPGASSAPARLASTPQPKPARKPAPPDTSKWDIEFHYGLGSGEPARGASGSLPDAGEAFTTNGGSPSRRVTSWYFGDGAVLINNVLGSFGRPERITPMDGMLTSGATEFSVGNSFGGRVTRRLTPIMGLEVGVDVGPATYTVTPATREALSDTSNSFPVVFSGLIATGQGVAFTNPVLSSTFAVSDGTGQEIVTTGALVFSTARSLRFRPYVVVGGGVAMGTGDASATVTGRYSFTLPSGGRVDETDKVTIRFSGGTGAVVLGGAGLSWRLGRASGVRVDGRLTFVQNHVKTLVDTAPSVAASVPADAIWSSLTPGIQFATHPSTNLASNLTAPSLSGFQTAGASGFKTRFTFTIGYFFRF